MQGMFCAIMWYMLDTFDDEDMDNTMDNNDNNTNNNDNNNNNSDKNNNNEGRDNNGLWLMESLLHPVKACPPEITRPTFAMATTGNKYINPQQQR
jgi:hypothetical protein